MTRCKICGITNLDDALAATHAGADAIGFVFYPPSPRYISPERAAKLIEALPPFVSTVGLFVDATPKQVEQVLSIAGIELLQFHGAESPAYCEQFNLPYIKAMGVTEALDTALEAEKFATAKALLFDTHDAKLKGGTGRTFNWQLVTKAISKPVILAGGLTPANVRNAIQSVRPYAVDVSGGVELASAEPVGSGGRETKKAKKTDNNNKGKKDPLLIEAFLREVHCERKT